MCRFFLQKYFNFLNIYQFVSYKNVDIKFSANDAFLEWSSSGTLKSERLENQII